MNASVSFPSTWRLCGVALAIFLTGCASFNGPYQAPAVNLPGQYAYAVTPTTATSTTASDAWWKNFADPELDRLVAEALARNSDLAAAAIRVRRAQLASSLADNALLPQFSASASTSARRALDGNTGTTRSSGASVGAGYEIDLWNKLGSQRDVARWDALATQQDRESAALTLVGTTARLYWQLAFLNQRLTSNAESIAYAQRTFELVQSQYRAGAVSGLELAEARQALGSQLASQRQLQQQAVEAQTALALLFDGPPGTVLTNPQRLPDNALPIIRPGLPVELLARRPDLRAAQLRLQGSFTNIDATRASYYPSLTLTGSLGTSSASLLNLLQNPVAALGAGISLPFLRRTEMKLNIQVSEADYEAAVVNYRQTLYVALGDVENSLSAQEQLAQQGVLLAQVLADARRVERLYEIQYRAGAATLKAWLDAQERRRSAEIAVAENRLARLSNQVGLYQALGGGDSVAF